MDKRLLSLLAVFFLAFGAFSISVFLATSKNIVAQPQQKAKNLLCIPSTIHAKVNSSVSVTCFARTEDGKAVPKTECCFKFSNNPNSSQCSQTDALGKTATQFTSETTGVVQITCQSGPIQSFTSVEFTP